MLTLIHDIRTENAVMGRLYFCGKMICYTLENAKKLIPCGMYTVQNSKSPKFKRELPLLFNKDVSSSRGIRIHSGNTWSSSQGCVLVGMGRDAVKGTLSESSLAETMVTMLCRSCCGLIICEEH